MRMRHMVNTAQVELFPRAASSVSLAELPLDGARYYSDRSYRNDAHIRALTQRDEEYLSDLGLHREDRGSLGRRTQIARSYEEQVDELVRVGVHEDDIDEAIAAMDVLMHYEEK